MLNGRWTSVAAVCLFAVFCIAQASRMFVLDEIDFPAIADAISRTGVPYYYRGEETPYLIGLYHPPLYIYALAGFVKAFGYSEVTVRLFGVLCTLATAAIIVALIAQLCPRRQQASLVQSLFLPLFLLNPYTIANTLLPDIDQTVLPVAIAGYLYALVRLFGRNALAGDAVEPRTRRPAHLHVMAALFCLCLWCKLTTPIALLPATGLLLLGFRFTIRQAAVWTAWIAAEGIALFLASYALYCAAFDLPFRFTFDFLVHSFTKGAPSSGGIGATVAKAWRTFADNTLVSTFPAYLTYFFCFAFAVAVAALGVRRKRTPADVTVLLLAGLALAVTAFYLALTGAFGGFFKYPFPVFALLVLPVAYSLGQCLQPASVPSNAEQLARARIAPASSALLLASLASATAWQLTWGGGDDALRGGRPLQVAWLLAAGAAAAILGYALARSPAMAPKRILAALLVGGVIGVSLGIDRTQAVRGYPTTYHYGQQGMAETVAYLRARVATGEPVFAMKDIGYYVNNKYFENYRFIFNPRLDDVLRTGRVQYFVVTTGVGQDRIDAYPQFKAALDECCAVARQFGNFVIYVLKQP